MPIFTFSNHSSKTRTLRLHLSKTQEPLTSRGSHHTIWFQKRLRSLAAAAGAGGVPVFALSWSHFPLTLTSLHSKALVEVLNDVGDREAALETKPKGSNTLCFSSQVVHVGHVGQTARLDTHVLLLLLPAGQVDALLTAAPPPPPHLPAALGPLQQVGGRHPLALLHLLLCWHLAALVIGNEHAGYGDGEGEGPSPPQKSLPGRLPTRPTPLVHLHLDVGG